MKYLVANSAWVDPVNLEMSFATSLLYFRIIARIWFMNELIPIKEDTIHEWIEHSGLKNQQFSAGVLGIATPSIMIAGHELLMLTLC